VGWATQSQGKVVGSMLEGELETSLGVTALSLITKSLLTSLRFSSLPQDPPFPSCSQPCAVLPGPLQMLPAFLVSNPLSLDVSSLTSRSHFRPLFSSLSGSFIGDIPTPDSKATFLVPKVTSCLQGPCSLGRLARCSDVLPHSSTF
jgi:hypothetical protein